MIDGDNDIVTPLQELPDLDDLELMDRRKSATNKTSLNDDDLRAIAMIAAEYVRRGYWVSGLWHLDAAGDRVQSRRDPD